MKVKKKLFIAIKAKYTRNMESSREQANKYQKLLDNYDPRFGSNNYLLEKYFYHKTSYEMYYLFLKELERLEGHI